MKLKKAFKFSILTLFILIIAFSAISCGKKLTPYELLRNSYYRTVNLVKTRPAFDILEDAKGGGSIEMEYSINDKTDNVRNKLKTKIYSDRDRSRIVQLSNFERGGKLVENMEIYIGYDHYVYGSNLLEKGYYGYELQKLGENPTYPEQDNPLIANLISEYKAARVMSTLLGWDKEATNVYAPYNKIIEEKLKNTSGIITSQKDTNENYVIKVKIDSKFLLELVSELIAEAKDDNDLYELGKRLALFTSNDFDMDNEGNTLEKIKTYISNTDILFEATVVVTKGRKLISNFDISLTVDSKKRIEASINLGKDSLYSKKIDGFVTFFKDGKATTVTLNYDASESKSATYKGKLIIGLKNIDDTESKKFAEINLEYKKYSGDFTLTVNIDSPSDIDYVILYPLSVMNLKANYSLQGKFVTTKKTAILTIDKYKYDVKLSLPDGRSSEIKEDFDLDFKLTILSDDKMPNIPKYDNIEKLKKSDFEALQEKYIENQGKIEPSYIKLTENYNRLFNYKLLIFDLINSAE